jgi:hypothetical protein
MEGDEMTNGMIEWKQLPRGTYRYSQNGLTADVWQVSGRGWLWSVYDGNDKTATSGLIAAHEGVYQPTLDAACEVALKVIETYREDSMTYECPCGEIYSRQVCTVCPKCFAWPLDVCGSAQAELRAINKELNELPWEPPLGKR